MSEDSDLFGPASVASSTGAATTNSESFDVDLFFHFFARFGEYAVIILLEECAVCE